MLQLLPEAEVVAGAQGAGQQGGQGGRGGGDTGPGERERHGNATRLTGRRSECNGLDRLLTDVQAGRSRALAFHGVQGPRPAPWCLRRHDLQRPS
jgi:hypothetical protein